MLNGLIFEKNKVSELQMKMFLKDAGIDLCLSYCKELELKEIMKLIDTNLPNCIVLEYELYCENIYDIMISVKDKLPDTRLFIVANKMKTKVKNELLAIGVSDVFIKPFIDEKVVSTISRLTNY